MFEIFQRLWYICAYLLFKIYIYIFFLFFFFCLALCSDWKINLKFYYLTFLFRKTFWCVTFTTCNKITVKIYRNRNLCHSFKIERKKKLIFCATINHQSLTFDYIDKNHRWNINSTSNFSFESWDFFHRSCSLIYYLFFFIFLFFFIQFIFSSEAGAKSRSKNLQSDSKIVDQIRKSPIWSDLFLENIEALKYYFFMYIFLTYKWKKKINKWNERMLFWTVKQMLWIYIWIYIYWYVQLEQIGIFVIGS